jgi:tetratricopeptide (TPR) repeat protein
LYNIGIYHLQVTREYDKALDLFRSSIEIFPKHWPAHHSAALSFILKGDLVEAEKRLETALATWPDNANLRLALGFVLLKTGKYDQAIKHSRQALSFNPDMSEALCVVGEASRRKGNDQLATLCWQRYLEKNPNDLQGNLALIELYARQNKKYDISRTIGNLMLLKGSKSLHELINQFLRDTKLKAYSPEPAELIAIIRGNLDEQFSQQSQTKAGRFKGKSR